MNDRSDHYHAQYWIRPSIDGDAQDARCPKPPEMFGDFECKLRVAVRQNAHRDGYSYSPKSDRVFDFDLPGHGQDFATELYIGNRYYDPARPVYMIAVTNHKGMKIDVELADGYDLAAFLCNQPVIGYWFDKDAREVFLDAVFVAQFEDDDVAIRESSIFRQAYIARLHSDGEYVHIQTEYAGPE